LGHRALPLQATKEKKKVEDFHHLQKNKLSPRTAAREFKTLNEYNSCRAWHGSQES
jgi:hypothetical protein